MQSYIAHDADIAFLFVYDLFTAKLLKEGSYCNQDHVKIYRIDKRYALENTLEDMDMSLGAMCANGVEHKHTQVTG